MFNPLSGNHPYVPYFVILPCLMPEDFICQEVDQWRKFGPGCPWSNRDWVPPRRGIIDLFEDEALTI